MYDELTPQMDDDFADAMRSIEELEESVSDAVLRRRSAPRHKLCVTVLIFPANPSDRGREGTDGITGDISSGGCLVFGSRAILPGDLYWIDFSAGEATDLGGLFARCLRCRFISETRFELGFQFMTPVDVDYILHDLLT